MVKTTKPVPYPPLCTLPQKEPIVIYRCLTCYYRWRALKNSQKKEYRKEIVVDCVISNDGQDYRPTFMFI